MIFMNSNTMSTYVECDILMSFAVNSTTSCFVTIYFIFSKVCHLSSASNFYSIGVLY